MFTPTLSNPKGIKKQASWANEFQAALNALQPFDPAKLDQLLATSLDAWSRGSAGLATEVGYQAAERYCIRQSYLWQIYAAIEAKGKGADASRTIYNRARDVVDETPFTARPADLSFLEGDNLIRKTLEHLRSAQVYYAQTLKSAGGLENATGPLPPSGNFQALTVVEANADPAQAEAMLQRFLGDNQYVRAILLGDDAGNGATILDNCIADPGAGITPGCALWVKSYTLLRVQISTWLGALQQHDYNQVRCIFMSAKGKPTDFLSKTDPLSFATVSREIVQAAQADLA